jgi:DNA repair protein RadA/Sms
MAKEKTIFVCNDCGGTSPQWMGKCPACPHCLEHADRVGGRKRHAGKNRFASLAKTAEVATLADIEASDVEPHAHRHWMNWTACWAAASSRAAWC